MQKRKPRSVAAGAGSLGPGEGMRARKRRQTRERIVNAALDLFLKHGFDSVTVDDIAAAADISKRSFFDYFPAKEDVIVAWQDSFGEVLAAAVAARPAGEALTRTVEEALTSAIAAAANPASLALDELIRNTPALRERDAVKYARLEQTLAAALLHRVKNERGRFRARLLAGIVITGLRLGAEEAVSEAAAGRGLALQDRAEDFTRKMFRRVWRELYELGGVNAT